jgi:ATP phosphoribosyltransferase regulatory subunit HisZ
MGIDERDSLVEMDRNFAFIIIDSGDVSVMRDYTLRMFQLVTLGAAQNSSDLASYIRNTLRFNVAGFDAASTLLI